MILRGLSALALLVWGQNVFAEAVPVTTAVVAKPSAAKILGSIDLRPSWTTKAGEFHSENMLLGGYQINEKVSTYAVYNFTTDVHNPEAALGLNPTTVDLSIRAKINKIYTEPSTGIILGYEPRFYLPMTDAVRTKGMITVMRNYIKLSKSITENYKLTFMDLPIIHFYDRAGAMGAANPVIENRFYLVNDFQLTKNISLSVPLFFHITKYRDFEEGAKNNAATTFFAWVNPEVSYSLNDNISLGLGYYSDNLVAGDLSDTAMGSGLEKGVLQFSLAASL